MASEPNLAIRIDDLLLEIEKDNPPLENVLPKIFSSSNIPNDNLKELIELFDSIKIEKEEEIAKDTFQLLVITFCVYSCEVTNPLITTSMG